MQRSAQVAAPERGSVSGAWRPRGASPRCSSSSSASDLSWALLVPPWQSPDELAHFAYVQSLAESFTIPRHRRRTSGLERPERRRRCGGRQPGRLLAAAGPAGLERRRDYAAYLAAEHAAHPPSRSNGTGPSTATGNPPLYYLFAAAAYLVDHGGTAFGRLYAIRIFGVLLLALTTIGAWLLAGEAFGRRRLPQLGCAAVAGLLPMATFMSTAVNPDALLITLWTLDAVAGSPGDQPSRPRRGTCSRSARSTAAAILTKATSYALVRAGRAGAALSAGFAVRAPSAVGP